MLLSYSATVHSIHDAATEVTSATAWAQSLGKVSRADHAMLPLCLLMFCGEHHSPCEGMQRLQMKKWMNKIKASARVPDDLFRFVDLPVPPDLPFSHDPAVRQSLTASLRFLNGTLVALFGGPPGREGRLLVLLMGSGTNCHCTERRCSMHRSTRRSSLPSSADQRSPAQAASLLTPFRHLASHVFDKSCVRYVSCADVWSLLAAEAVLHLETRRRNGNTRERNAL